MCKICHRGLNYAEAKIGLGQCEECNPAVLWEIQEAEQNAKGNQRADQSARSIRAQESGPRKSGVSISPRRVTLRAAPGRMPPPPPPTLREPPGLERGRLPAPSPSPWRTKQAADAAHRDKGARNTVQVVPRAPKKSWPRKCVGCPYKPSALAAQWNDSPQDNRTYFLEICCQRCHELVTLEDTGKDRGYDSQEASMSRSPSQMKPERRSRSRVKTEGRHSTRGGASSSHENPMQQEIIRQASKNLAKRMYQDMVKKEEE